MKKTKTKTKTGKTKSTRNINYDDIPLLVIPPYEETEDEYHDDLIVLKKAAITGTIEEKNSPRIYDVHLKITKNQENKDHNNLWVISTGGRKGGWYFGTLLEDGLPSKDAELSIWGDWLWFNYGDVMNKLVRMIDDEGLDIKKQLKLFKSIFRDIEY